LPLLTTREHLTFYAGIKGIPHHMRDAMIEELISELNLSEFRDINAGTYSGGNKRKLSVAISMLGNP